MERIEAPTKPRFASPAVRALAENVPEIDHYELDGIPLFHLPGAGATILTLRFAVGAALRSPGMPPQFRLYWLRTGYQGLGTTHLPEFFLHTLDEQVLRDWIGQH